MVTHEIKVYVRYVQEEPEDVAPFRVGKTTNPETEEGRDKKPGVISCTIVKYVHKYLFMYKNEIIN